MFGYRDRDHQVHYQKDLIIVCILYWTVEKVLIVFVVGVANIIDVYVLDTGEVIRNAVIFFYITNELISVFENVVECGVPIPQKLTDVLALISKKGDSADGNHESADE